MRVAVYGGSFNPPHFGHAWVATWLRWADRADEVWLVPAFDHAFDKNLAPFSLRVRCCEAMAAAVGPALRVSTIEAELPAPSYTVRTLDTLSARHPEHRFQLVIGADNVPSLPLWREWPRIEATYAPIVVGREGYPPVPGAPMFPGLSSTEVRERLAAGEAVDHLVFPAVAKILREEWG